MRQGSQGEASPEDVFAGSPAGLELYRAVARLLADPVPAKQRASKSQVAFSERRGFAYMWWPGRYLASKVPAVLSIALPRRIDSGRFKEVVSVSPGIWMHHLELWSEADVDEEVAAWLKEARREAA